MPEVGFRTSSGALPGSSDWLGAPRGEADPLGAQPLPRVLELAAFKAADVTAFDHPGTATSLPTQPLRATPARLLQR